MKKSTELKKGIPMLLSCITWALVMVACSWQLKGTGGYQEISNILLCGFMVHFLYLANDIADGKAKAKEVKTKPKWHNEF